MKTINKNHQKCVESHSYQLPQDYMLLALE